MSLVVFVRGWIDGSLGGSSCLRSRSVRFTGTKVGGLVLELVFLRFIDSSTVNGLDRANESGVTGSSTVVVSDMFGSQIGSR